MTSKLLPAFEDIVKTIADKLGRPADEIQKEVMIFGESLMEPFPKDPQLWAAIFAQQKGIQITVKLPKGFVKGESVGLVKISDITPDSSRFDLNAYVVRLWDTLTVSARTHAKALWLLDDTGFIQSRVWGEDANKMWDKLGIKNGDLIHIGNANTFQPSDEAPLFVGIGNYSTVEKTTPEAVGIMTLDSLTKTKIADIDGVRFAAITGVLLGVEPTRTYNGCPKCMTSVEEQKDGKFFCNKCGNMVRPVEYTWHTAIVTDGSDVSIDISPTDKKTLGDFERLRFEPVKIYGICDGKSVDLGFYEEAAREKTSGEKAASKFIKPAGEKKCEKKTTDVKPPEKKEYTDVDYEPCIAHVRSMISKTGASSAEELKIYLNAHHKRNPTFPEFDETTVGKLLDKGVLEGKIVLNGDQYDVTG